MRSQIVTVVLVLTLGGCAAPKSSRGWISGAQVGNPFPDFVYVDDQGVRRSLRNLAGDFTVLAFSRCDTDTHGPAAGLLQEIVSENAAAAFVRVVGVDVHWFDGRCDHGHCHIVAENPNLFSICDATGTVRRLYGVEGGDSLVVIDPNGRIVQVFKQSDSQAARTWLKRAISRESSRRARALSEEYDDMARGK